MCPRPTPIADELMSLAAALASGVRTQTPLVAAELQHIAYRLAELGRKTAGLERFHADVVADAQEDELLQSVDHFRRGIAASGG